MDYSEVRRILKELGIRADKRMGQHFLIDDRIAHRHVEFAGIGDNETVLEIGPGLGILTEILSKKSKDVVAIEKDTRLCRFLEARFPSVHIMEGDALLVDLPQFDVVVSNLPYQISSPFIFRLLKHEFDRAVLMFQREFAERIVAGRGQEGYSRLSVHVYHKAETGIIENVPRTAFFPQPEVDSAIVSLSPRSSPFQVKDESQFSRLVDHLFQHRRKTLAKSLSLSWDEFGDSQDAVRKIVELSGFARKRVGELSPEELGELADRLWMNHQT